MVQKNKDTGQKKLPNTKIKAQNPKNNIEFEKIINELKEKLKMLKISF